MTLSNFFSSRNKRKTPYLIKSLLIIILGIWKSLVRILMSDETNLQLAKKTNIYEGKFKLNVSIFD